MVWSWSSSSVWEVASEEDDSWSCPAGPKLVGGVSPPPVVGNTLGSSVVLMVAAVACRSCNLRTSAYLSLIFLKTSGSIPCFFLAASNVSLCVFKEVILGGCRSGLSRSRFARWGALMKLLELINPQVEESTRFDPEDILLHSFESRSTHLFNYLHEVSHVPQGLPFSPEQPIPHVLWHVI